jgi:NAD+ kinase
LPPKIAFLMPVYSTIGVVTKRGEARVAATFARLLELLRPHGCRVLLERPSGDLLDDPALAGIERSRVEVAPLDELGARSDLLVVLGGDGTLLGAARCMARHGVPILGINQGRLGFLVEVRPEQLDDALEATLRGEAQLERRQLLSSQVRRADGTLTPPVLAVNDVVLRTRGSIRMIEFDSWLDDEFISRHRADGMIISTATGSTAYALSGGGPVLHPALAALLFVPICPHTLSDRPIVVPADRRVRICLSDEGGGAAVTCDGQVDVPLAAGDAVEISCANQPLQLLHPPGYSYFGMLRSKLAWGRGPVDDRRG